MLRNTTSANWLIALIIVAIGMCYLVIGLGVFTRLTDAGLACPNWPTCYGQNDPNQGESLFIQHKALYEMVHRYVAGALGFLILWIVGLSFRVSKQQSIRLGLFPLGLLILLVYQVLLGRFTVTLKLMPIIVTQHLLAGLLILSFLWILYLRTQHWYQSHISDFKRYQIRFWIRFTLFVAIMQIVLGAWTSSHYAGLSCQGFPFCNGGSFRYDFKSAFQLLFPVGMNYEGGVLSGNARMTIHMLHRFGAAILVISCVALFVVIRKRCSEYHSLKRLSVCLLWFLAIQIGLGIVNVLFQLPLFVAILHNLMAATVLLIIVTMNDCLYRI